MEIFWRTASGILCQNYVYAACAPNGIFLDSMQSEMRRNLSPNHKGFSTLVYTDHDDCVMQLQLAANSAPFAMHNYNVYLAICIPCTGGGDGVYQFIIATIQKKKMLKKVCEQSLCIYLVYKFQ